MRLAAICKRLRPTVSFEFFPPKTDEAADSLFQTVSEQLESLGPSFVSVTYGAGGSTRNRTHNLVLRMHRETSITVVPHLTCIGSSRDEIGAIVQSYVDAGIENVLALRGDMPAEMKADQPSTVDAGQGFTYANELVAFLRKEFPALGIGVAGYPEGHPETASKLADLENLKRKVDAGADAVLTQLFFDNRDFYDFIERCELIGIHAPILAGVMPIQSIPGIKRMAGLSGARLPAPLLRALERAGDDAQAVANVGAHWATEQCRDLVDHNVAGLHLYTLNKSSATRHIYQSLGIRHSSGLRTASPQ